MWKGGGGRKGEEDGEEEIGGKGGEEEEEKRGGGEKGKNYMNQGWTYTELILKEIFKGEKPAFCAHF